MVVNRVGRFQFDPAFAAGVGGVVGDCFGVLQVVRADGQEIQRLVWFVVPAQVELGGGPAVEVVEGIEGFACGDLPDVGGFAKAANGELGGFRGAGFNLVAPLRLDAVGLLVEPSGEEGEAGRGKAEAAGAVGLFDAALAEEDGLVTGEEAVDDEGPFFEGGVEHGERQFRIWDCGLRIGGKLRR